MEQAYISPDMLTWARQRSGYSLDECAKKIRIKLEKLEEWERGETHPSYLEAKTIAKKLKIPFGYLYLSSPPSEKLPLPDLRTVLNNNATISIDFRDTLYDALKKQQWYKEHLLEENKQKLSFVGQYTLQDPPKQVAQEIADYLKVSNSLRNQAANWEEFLKKLIEHIEDAGILVLRNGIVGNNTKRILNVEEFRGFAISDAIAPLIFINNRDTKAAQIFTLAHELAHLWINQSGVSNFDMSRLNPDMEVEFYCNQVAAEFLVPEVEFKHYWKKQEIENNLRELPRRFKVSSLVILRRAFDLNQVGIDEYRQLYNKQLDAIKNIQSTNQGGGNFYYNVINRNSRKLISAVIECTYENRILFRDAAALLNIKVKQLENIPLYLED